MELNTISKTKNKAVFEIKGESHTFCNVLRDELWEDSDVTASGYSIKHPLVGIPKFIIETKSKDVVSVLENTSKSIKKKANDFKKEFSKI
ncbi:MAG: DNA-directed RNA polymerase subunit L [bacterium]